MAKKSRLGLYLEDEEIKRQIKVAAAKRGISATVYCTQAIEDRLKREGEFADRDNVFKRKQEFISRVDNLKIEIGPLAQKTSELVDEGRRR